MAEEEKYRAGRGASIPSAGGWENMPLPERLRGTFERGVVRGELDLADAYQKGIQPGHIPEVQRRLGREIAAEFGGKFSVHAPYQVEFSSPSYFQQADAAEILRQTVQYAKDMGARVITMHPTAVMGAGFVDPFTGQLQPVPAHLLCKDKAEFDQWCSSHGINPDNKNSTLYTQLAQQWDNFFRAQSSVMTQQHAAAAPVFLRDFAQYLMYFQPYLKATELKQQGKLDLTLLKASLEAALVKQAQSMQMTEHSAALAPFAETAKHYLQQFNAPEYQKNLEKIYNEVSSADLKSLEEEYKEKQEAIRYMWARATLCVGGSIKPDGTIADSYKSDRYGLSEKEVNFRAALAGERIIDLPHEEDNIIKAFTKTLDFALRDPEVQRAIKEGKLTISLENIWGVNPESGWMNGFAYYNRPQHMIKALKAAQEVARQYGLPEDAFALTFDTEHAAVGYDPEKFLDELKAAGVKIANAHVVGGGHAGAASVFGHKGIGTMEDEILRQHPHLLEKIAETGAPMTIEPGSGGIKDIEGALETLITGQPTEAMLGAPMGETAMRRIGYAEAPSYYQAFYHTSQAFVNKGGFYSFGSSLPQPFRATYGPLASPTLYQGGLFHREPPTTLWPSQQPVLYSTRVGEDEQK